MILAECPVLGPCDDDRDIRGLPGLSLWLDASARGTLSQDALGSQPVSASGQPVGAWGDLSGNGRCPIQTLASGRPTWLGGGLNSRPSVDFDGVDDWLVWSGASLAQPNTVFLVFRCHRTSNAMLIDGTATSGRNLMQINSGQWQIFAGGTAGGSGTADTAVHVWTAVFDGAGSSFRMDGAPTSVPSLGTNPMTGLTLGRHWSTAVHGQGSLSELAVFNRLLSSSDVDLVERRLRRKWGIA